MDGHCRLRLLASCGFSGCGERPPVAETAKELGYGSEAPEWTLTPELTVWHGGRKTVFADGFWPLSLHANRMVEFRWVKQPLRDHAVGTRGMLAVSAPAADGTVEVSGEVSSAEELRPVKDIRLKLVCG